MTMTKKTNTADASSATTALQICGRKTKETYTFSRIKNRKELVDTLLSPPTIPQRQAARLVREIKDALAARDERHEQLLASGMICDPPQCTVYLPIEALRANPEFSRETLIDWAHVADIGANFDPKAYGRAEIHVRRVVNKRGKFLYWSFELIDWTHRLVVAIDRGLTHVECAVTLVGDIAESARVMGSINGTTRNMNPTDSMRNRIVGKNKRITRVIDLLSKHKLTGRTSTKTQSDHDVLSLPKCEKIYNQYGEDVLDRVLDLITTPRLGGWYSRASASTPDMLLGLAMVVQAEKSGYIHTALLREIMETNSPDSIVNQNQNELSARAAEDLYGTTVSNTSEEGRAKRNFCVFMRQAQMLLKNGKAQMQHKNRADFKKLLNAYYRMRKADSAKTRKIIAGQIAAIRRRLYAEKVGDFWFDPEKEETLNQTTTKLTR